MKSTRWRLSGAFVAAALAAGCTKSSTDTSASRPATGTAAEPLPAAPGSAHAGTTVPGAHSEVPPSERAAAMPAAGAAAMPAAGVPTTPAGAPAAGADLVAIGGEREKVLSMGAGKVVAEATSYSLHLAAPAKVAKGAEGVATLEIRPKKGWHLNKEFPTKLTVTPPAGVSLTKAEQVLADATTWGEDSGTFSVRFAATAAGTKDFAGKLRFAVCTETTCEPQKEELAWAVAVE